MGDLTRDRMINPIKVASGTRDNQRDAKPRVVHTGGKFDQGLSADEIVELLLMSVRGGVAPVQQGGTTPNGAYLWTFTPGPTLDSGTVEWYDGYRNWQQRGARIDELKISGAVEADAKVNATFFGQEMVPVAQTAGLTDRVPDFMEGWELRLYIDAFGAAPGTTVVPGTIITHDTTFKNNLFRKYYGDNTTAAGDIKAGELHIQGDILLEANASALAEYNTRDAATKRLIRLELGNNSANIGTSTLKKKVTIDIPCFYSAIDLTPDQNGTKVYKFTYQYVYDPTNAFGIQIQVTNGRATAY